ATPDQLAKVVDGALGQTSGQTSGQVSGQISGQTWVIMSTVGPASITAQGARLVAAGAKVIDAPVTGGVARAATGELTIFTAGKPAEIAAVANVLDTMGTVRMVGEALG
ncbi:NAD(P)-binding domain-containing protein, partial [Rhodovulum sp. PH10]|uniref:NAD(P)-binding domain-containing protein n=1 Tax=Rhodovulum sp. PH10 TaxID=1187851 RepID=UPI00058FB7C1